VLERDPDANAPSRSSVTASLSGDVAPGWGLVADAFRANFAEGLECGSACSVYHRGRCVVDLWGGTADSRTGDAWAEDTVTVAFSTTTSIAFRDTTSSAFGCIQTCLAAIERGGL
jgi:hypothetical protein